MTGIRGSKYSLLSYNPTNYIFLLLPLVVAYVALPCLAQQAADDNLPSAPSSQAQSSQGQSSEGQSVPDNTRVTVPVGTRIDLVLTHPLDTNSVHAGDSLFAQTTAPVLVDDQVAIPAGAFIRGTIGKLRRNGTRGELFMQSASLVVGSSVINVGGPVNIESENWTAWNNPSGRNKALIILVPMAAMPLGALIGHAADGHNTTNLGGMTVSTPSHTGLVVGTAVGFGVGLGTAFGLMAHNRQFYLEDGSPMHMTLTRAVSLTREQISWVEHTAAPMNIARHLRAPAIVSPTDTGTCFTPGTPGTPDTVIPGTPGANGSLGTPSITIPGTPATPAIPHPCP